NHRIDIPCVKIGADRIGQQTLLQAFFRYLKVKFILTLSSIEKDTTISGFQHLGQYPPVCVKHSVRKIVAIVCEDVASAHHLEMRWQWRICIDEVCHERHAAFFSGCQCPPDTLQVL